MERRVPASERTREALRYLIKDRSVTKDARSELIWLATRLIAEEPMEGEQVRDVLDNWRLGVPSGVLLARPVLASRSSSCLTAAATERSSLILNWLMALLRKILKEILVALRSPPIPNPTS